MGCRFQTLVFGDIDDRSQWKKTLKNKNLGFFSALHRNNSSIFPPNSYFRRCYSIIVIGLSKYAACVVLHTYTVGACLFDFRDIW